MKLSEVDAMDVQKWGNIESNEDYDMIQRIIMPSAKSRLTQYTGLSLEQLEEKEDVTLAFIALCVFLYDNRTMNILNEKPNEVVQSFLDAHRVNLL